MKKLLIVEEHSAPYRDETYGEIIRLGYDLKVLSAVKKGKNDNHSEWNYESKMEAYRCYSHKVYNTKIGDYRTGLIKLTKKFNPDVLCTSSALEAFIFKLLFHKRVVLRSDNMKKGKHADSFINRIILSALYGLGDAIWVPGNAAEKYYRFYLKNKKNIFQGAYTYDAHRIKNEIDKNSLKREVLRKNIGISDNCFVFLFIGKLIESRHIEVLLTAIDKISRDSCIKFLIIGDGPMQNMVIEKGQQNKMIKYIPSVPIKDLEIYYSISDAYVHPGEEPYSLAVYEAAISALPIVASNYVGAALDCLKDSYNGYVYEFGNSNDLYNKITKLYDNYSVLKENALHVQEFILNERGIKWSAKQLLLACDLYTKHEGIK